MGIVDRIARLEKQLAPPKPTMADRLAEACNAFDKRWRSMTREQRAEYERQRYERALAAEPPGPNASELRLQLYLGMRCAARFYFAQQGRLAEVSMHPDN